MGVSDIVDELKIRFFNCLLPSPQPSLATRAMLVLQGEGAYQRLTLLPFTTQSLNLGYFKFIPLYIQDSGVGVCKWKGCCMNTGYAN